MAKLKINCSKKGKIDITCKLEKAEKINPREIELFNTKLYCFLIKPVVHGSKITYTLSNSTTLHTYLQSLIRKNDFFLVLAQINEAVKKSVADGLNLNNLRLSTKCVFVNENTRELNFIYEPVINSANSSNIFSFLYEVIQTAVIRPDEDRSFIKGLVDFLRGMSCFDTDKFEKYIMGEFPDVYNQIQRSGTSQNGTLKNKKWDVDAGFVSDTGFSGGEYFDVYGETSLLSDDSAGETSLLLEDDAIGTTLLQDGGVNYPYLIRKSNFDRVDIDKPVFRIGKEKSYVDYFVADNNAVSRIHADIITRDGSYYIRDDNSTNGTFVNGKAAAPNRDTEISNGDVIVLANEEFEFHAD